MAAGARRINMAYFFLSIANYSQFINLNKEGGQKPAAKATSKTYKLAYTDKESFSSGKECDQQKIITRRV